MKFLLREILAPVGVRMGSVIAGALLAFGAPELLAGQVEAVVPALLAFAADIVVDRVYRKGLR